MPHFHFVGLTDVDGGVQINLPDLQHLLPRIVVSDTDHNSIPYDLIFKCAIFARSHDVGDKRADRFTNLLQRWFITHLAYVTLVSLIQWHWNTLTTLSMFAQSSSCWNSIVWNSWWGSLPVHARKIASLLYSAPVDLSQLCNCSTGSRISSIQLLLCSSASTEMETECVMLPFCMHFVNDYFCHPVTF